MRNRVYIVFLFLCSYANAQEPGFNLIETLKSKEYDEIQTMVASYVQKYGGSEFAFYVQAITDLNAKNAAEKYNLLLEKYPDSDQAEVALFRLAQYYYSRGLYISARRYFLDLIEKYPNSPFVDDALYFSASCLYASKMYESCRTELKHFLANHPRSAYVDMAKEDLKDIEALANGEVTNELPTTNNSNGKYKLQVGAFTNANNALNLRNYFANFGLPVEITEKRENNVTYYVVLLGSFENKEAAQAYGDKFSKEHGKPFRIISMK